VSDGGDMMLVLRMLTNGMSPIRRVPPSEEGDRAENEPRADAADGDVTRRAGLAAIRGRVDALAPVAAEDFDHETDERQQPRGSEKPLERFAGREVCVESQGSGKESGVRYQVSGVND